MSSENHELNQLILMIYSLTGIKLTEQKKTMILRRITPNMKKLGVTEISDFCNRVQSSELLKQELINAITTNETQFFRTKRVWDFFKDEFLINWYNKNPKNELNVWSCASSSGEEPYSIAILCEEFKKSHKNFQYKIMATDIATDEIAKAENGKFSEKSVKSIDQKFPLEISEYFNKTNSDEYEIKSFLKKNIIFKQHNLFSTLKTDQLFDIAYLRNVLIYFEKQDQQKVINHIEKKLLDSGILILGESESLNNQLPSLIYQSPLIYKKVG